MSQTQDELEPAEPDVAWPARLPEPEPERPTHALATSRGDAAGFLPVPWTPAELEEQVQELRRLTAVAPTTAVRRSLFMWLRIFVLERKARGKVSRVNVRVPIPLPLIGLLLPWRMSRKQALALLAEVHQAADSAALAQRTLAGHTALEIIHVEEANPNTGASTYVVVGLE